MRPIVPVLGSLLALGLGCATNDGGTGPSEPPPPAASFDVAVTLERITVLGICEELFTDIDGGEFSYTFHVAWPDGGLAYIAATNDYPSATSYRQAGAGTNWTFAVPTVRRTLTPNPGDKVAITFRAIEWDWDAFGNNPFRDSRMNDRRAEFVSTFQGGAWTIQQGAMDLRESSACHVRANVGVAITPR
jgi:hypothetical protein